MNKQPDAQLSSLVDGELDESECSAALDSVLKNNSHRCCWERYHLIGDAMRRNLPRVVDSQLSVRVMAALKDEPTVLAPPVKSGNSFGKQLAGLAVAASVAAVAVFGVQYLYQEDGLVKSQEQMAKAPVVPMIKRNDFAGRDIQLATESSSHPNVQPMLNPRLNQYLLDHNQQSARIVHGVMPYARIVIHPDVKDAQK